MSSIIKVNNLSKKYQLGQRGSSFPTLRDALSRVWRSTPPSVEDSTLWALKDISFELEAGDTVGLIGRNGAGKSTLLKILSRITLPTAGSVELYGRVGSLLEVGTGFHPELTGRENVFLNGAILGMSRREITRQFDEIVAFAEVEKFMDTPVKRYSSGMYMRLAFAVAAHLSPDILLVDEVLAVGDAQFQAKCLGKMDDVSQQGRTVIFVSHNSGAVSKLCKKSLLLQAGRVTEVGPTAEVLAKYLQLMTQDTNGSVEFPASSGLACFSKIQVVCPVNGPSSSIDVKLGCSVRFEYLTKQPLQKLDIGFAVIDSNGSRVFTSSLSMVGGESHEVGFHAAEAQIPADFLAPGRYLITAALHQPNVQSFDVKLEAVGFAVVETGSDMQNYSGSDVGSVLVNLNWNRETTTHSTTPQEVTSH